MTYFPAYPIFFSIQLSHKARKKEGYRLFLDGHREGYGKLLQCLVPDPSPRHARLVEHPLLHQEQGRASGAHCHQASWALGVSTTPGTTLPS